MKLVHLYIGQHFPLEARDPILRFSSGVSGTPVWTLRLVARSCTRGGPRRLQARCRESVSGLSAFRQQHLPDDASTLCTRNSCVLASAGWKSPAEFQFYFLCGTATFFARHSWASLLGFPLPPRSRFRLHWTLTLGSSGPLRVLFASHHAGHRVLHDCGMAFFSLSFVARHLF